MFCQSCGSPVEAAFCSKCGAPAHTSPVGYGAPPSRMYDARVQRHVQTLGILWCVYGAYRAAAGVFASLFLMGMSVPGFFAGWWMVRGIPFMPFMPIMGGIAALVAAITLIGSVLAFAPAFALLNRKPWGRPLAIVVAVLPLLRPLLGSALGIYTLWVLVSAASGAEYDAIADHS